jgi:hypothetical protein
MTRACWLLLAVAACRSGSDQNPFLAAAPRTDPPSPAVVEACQLARSRCSRCHSVDRILTHSAYTPIEWETLVHRMRMMTGSAIHQREEPALVRCFVFKTSGNAGLARMAQETP